MLGVVMMGMRMVTAMMAVMERTTGMVAAMVVTMAAAEIVMTADGVIAVMMAMTMGTLV